MIRTVIVDDSRLMRSMIHKCLSQFPDIHVVGEAPDTQTARQLIKGVNPDVITLDVEMPGMNGLDFLEKIMKLRPMPVIMVSSLTDRGTDTALAALELGAIDAVPKPGIGFTLNQFGQMLGNRVRMAARARISQRSVTQNNPPQSTLPPTDIIAIGASTGGVSAIGAVLQNIPRDAPPVIIVQHMPETYTTRFADRLDKQLPVDVREACDGEVLGAGMVRIAPGGTHLTLKRIGGRLITFLSQTDLVEGHRPSVDVMFHSLVANKITARAALLTGMGRDGAAGMLALRQAGHVCLAQDEASCVVYGMPRVAVELGAVSEVLSIDHIGARLFTKSQDRLRNTAHAS